MEEGGALRPMPAGWELHATGEPFSYPFMQTAEPGEQRLHYPRLADLLHLTRQLPALAAVEPPTTPPPPLALRVLVLWRPPLAALTHLAAAKPPRFWVVSFEIPRSFHSRFPDFRPIFS